MPGRLSRRREVDPFYIAPFRQPLEVVGERGWRNSPSQVDVNVKVTGEVDSKAPASKVAKGQPWGLRTATGRPLLSRDSES